MADPIAKYVEQRVLDAAANDYESLVTIVSDVERWAATDQKRISKDLICNAVEQLAANGKLHVYKYSKEQNKYLPTQYSKDVLDELWFSVPA